MTHSLKREKMLFPHPIVIPKLKQHAFSAPVSHHSTLTSHKTEKKHRFEDSYKEYLKREETRKIQAVPNQVNRISKRSAENSLNLEEVEEEWSGNKPVNVNLPEIRMREARPANLFPSTRDSRLTSNKVSPFQPQRTTEPDFSLGGLDAVYFENSKKQHEDGFSFSGQTDRHTQRQGLNAFTKRDRRVWNHKFYDLTEDPNDISLADRTNPRETRSSTRERPFADISCVTFKEQHSFLIDRYFLGRK